MEVTGSDFNDAFPLGFDVIATGQGAVEAAGVDAVEGGKCAAELVGDGGVAAVASEGLAVEPGVSGDAKGKRVAHRQCPERQRHRDRQDSGEAALWRDRAKLALTGACGFRDAHGDAAVGAENRGTVAVRDRLQRGDRPDAGRDVAQEAGEVRDIGGGR